MMEQRPAAEVKWGEWINEGWQLFANQWQVWVPLMLVFILALVVPILPVYLLIIGMSIAQGGGDPEAGLPVFAPLLGLVGGLLTLGLASFMLGGIYRTAFKQMRGQAISIRDLFSGGDVTLNMLLGLFLVGLCAGIGGMLCLIPGFLAMGLLYFTFPLIVEKKLSPLEAMKQSFELTRPNMLMFTLFAFVTALLGSAGQLACYVGLLVTYPLQFLIAAAAYKDCFGLSGMRPAGAIPGANPAYPPQAYNQQSWANQPPQGYGQPPQPQAPYGQPPRPYGQQPQQPPPPFGQQPPPPYGQQQPPQQPYGQPPQPQPRPFSPPPPPPAQEGLPPTQVMPPSTGQGGPQVAPPGQTICPHCRALLQRSARFCNYCGKSLPQ